jgi:hypothetical protein
MVAPVLADAAVRVEGVALDFAALKVAIMISVDLVMSLETLHLIFFV